MGESANKVVSSEAPASSTDAGVRAPAQGSFAASLMSRPKAGSPTAIPALTQPAAQQPVADDAGDEPAGDADEVQTGDEPVAEPAQPVVGSGGSKLSSETLTTRLERERKRILKAEYGTTDQAEISRIKAERAKQAEEYAALKAKQDEVDRQSMTEQQRLAADNETLKKQNAELNEKLTAMQERQVIDQQTNAVSKIAGTYVDPLMIEEALFSFQRHVSKLSPDEVKRLTPRAIDRWFKNLAETKPGYKLRLAAGTTGDQKTDDPKIAAPAKVADPKPPVRRIALTTSNQPKGGAAKPAPKAPAAGTVAGKTVRPGQPNSMSRAELNAHLKSKGMRPW